MDNTPTQETNKQALDEIVSLIQQAKDLAQQGSKEIQISCEGCEKDAAEKSDITISCHALWTPMLFSCVAAEGLSTVYIHGLDVCKACPKQLSQASFSATIDDYNSLSQAMGIKLNIKQGVLKRAAKKPVTEKNEPSRRAFFRNVIPTLVKNASDSIEQLNQATTPQSTIALEMKQDKRNLPTENKLFNRALPQLEINHVPVPAMKSLALGSIQADDKCTACGDCVSICPSQALSLKPFGQNSILEFYADRCTGCNECVTACPTSAIQPLPSISLPTLLLDKARPLVMVMPTT